MINTLIPLVRQAGELALRYFDPVPALTGQAALARQPEADVAVEQFLVSHLREAYPTYGILSEESYPHLNAAEFDNIWVIDPIDGTTAFRQGLPGWGISVGLLRGGQPRHGIYYMPLLDDLTYTAGETEVYQGSGRDLRGAVRDRPGNKDFLATTASAHRAFTLDAFRLRALGSVGANLIYTARGVAAAAFLPRPRLWDLAAGAAILIRAGGTLRYLSGAAINYPSLLTGHSTPEPVIAGAVTRLAEIQEKVHPV